MASVDLSAAFDIVNVNMLLKRLKKVGLPNDVIDLIEIWQLVQTMNHKLMITRCDGTVQK